MSNQNTINQISFLFLSRGEKGKNQALLNHYQGGGIFLYLILAVFVLAVLGSMFGQPSKEELAAKIESIAKAQVDKSISPTGKISQIFTLGSEYTDVQRENAEKEIIGKIVEWSLPVYEVKKNDDHYRIQTTSGKGYVGTFLKLYPRNDDERKYIEALQTGRMIDIKGEIKGVTMRNIEVEPAILASK